MTKTRSESQLTQAREIELAELAEWIADEHCSSTPIEPSTIARMCGITVSQNNYGSDFDGLLECKNGRFHIYCNAGNGAVDSRVRFTLAHELGHYFIDEHRLALESGRVQSHGSYCDFSSENPVEREADHFASHLLMPTNRLDQRLRGVTLQMPTIERIAHEFSTSLTSTAIHLVRRNMTTAIVVLWRDGEFRWRFLSQDARIAGLRSALRPSGELPHDSATARVITERPTVHVRAASTAAAWFSGIRPGSEKDCLLSEESKNLGRFGVLTLLTKIG